ncbi:hypothetical protein PN467_03450 [Microcystis aeruginosa CS-563/04]|nr:hypothetical protein [Microcystis aeruginosa]MDB9419602.1 hypothetical protein [Microcystis aeruginosa CS-563/04]NCR07700.1 hypothetical protein [Microcystis aeruginosa LG13-11]
MSICQLVGFCQEELLWQWAIESEQVTTTYCYLGGNPPKFPFKFDV